MERRLTRKEDPMKTRKNPLGLESLEDRRTLSTLMHEIPPTPMTAPQQQVKAIVAAPVIKAQAQAPLCRLQCVNIAGDPNKRITAYISVPTGTLSYGGNRNIQVSSISNGRGGTTLVLTGTASNLNRNFAAITYRGFETRALIQIGTNGRVCASATLQIRRI